jgi:hypothetical protein
MALFVAFERSERILGAKPILSGDLVKSIRGECTPPMACRAGHFRQRHRPSADRFTEPPRVSSSNHWHLLEAAERHSER